MVVINNFLKKEQMMTKMIKKSKGMMKKRHLQDIDMGEIPEAPASLKPIIDPIKEKMNDSLMKVNNKEIDMKNIFESLTDSQIASLKDLFNPEGDTKKLHTEDKIYPAAKIVLSDDLQVLDTCISHIKDLQNNVIQSFLEVFAKSYHNVKGYELTYNLAKVFEDIRAITDYRRGVRRSVESSERNFESVEQSNCFIM